MRKLIAKMFNKLDQKAVNEIIKNVDNFLFDCDGVLWKGSSNIPGCTETVQKLTKLGKRIFYVSNNSSKTRAEYAEKITKFGFPAKEENVVCTAYIAALYLKEISFKGKLYVVGNPSMGQELDSCGIKHTGIGPDSMDADIQSFHDLTKIYLNWKPDPEITGVLVGFDAHHNYKKMVKASTYARNKNNIFVATNEDSYLPVKSDVVIPGTGSIVASIKIPAHREPVVVGKPTKTMFDILHQEHGLESHRTLMVGDRCDTDIALAGNCGLRSLLVLTGVESEESIEIMKKSKDPEIESKLPEFVTNSLGDMAALLPDL